MLSLVQASMNERSMRKLKQRIIQGMREMQKRFPSGAIPPDAPGVAELLQDMFDYLRIELRKMDMPKDGAVCFTELLRDKFLEIVYGITKDPEDLRTPMPERLLRSQTIARLQSFMAECLLNLMIDHSRRKNLWRTKVRGIIEKKMQERTHETNTLEQLMRERDDYLQTTHQISLDQMLQACDRWKLGTTAEREMAEVMKRRYVNGQPRKDVAIEMGLTENQVKTIQAKANRLLKEWGGAA